MKLVTKEKKEFKKDKVLSIICIIFYALALFFVRFMDYFETIITDKYRFAAMAVMLIVITVFLNYIMCRNGVPDVKLFNKINDFNRYTTNKNEIKSQRDILLDLLKEKKFSRKVRFGVYILEIVVCIVGYILFVHDVKFANRVVGIIVDLQTILMALWFALDTHYKFKIDKNLDLSK